MIGLRALCTFSFLLRPPASFLDCRDVETDPIYLHSYFNLQKKHRRGATRLRCFINCMEKLNFSFCWRHCGNIVFWDFMLYTGALRVCLKLYEVIKHKKNETVSFLWSIGFYSLLFLRYRVSEVRFLKSNFNCIFSR